MATANLTAARLRELLDYSPSTGLFTWRVQRSNVAKGAVAGTLKSDGYLQIGIDGRLYIAHRLVFLHLYGELPKADVDHINGDILDNRIENLRDVPRLLNMQNLRKAQRNNRTGFLGVSLTRDGTFTARIRNPGASNTRTIGTFKTAEEAHAAYVAAKRLVHAGCTI